MAHPTRRLLLLSSSRDPSALGAIAELSAQLVHCASLGELRARATAGDVAVIVEPSPDALEELGVAVTSGLAVVLVLEAGRIGEVPVVEGLEVAAPAVTVPELRARIDRAVAAARARAGRHDREEERVQRARFRALRDQLTGLPNARMFGERLDHALQRVRRDGEPLTVAVLRVGSADDHPSGLGRGRVELLRRIADRLREALRSTDTVAVGHRFATVSRSAAPEFFVLLPAGRGHADPSRAVARLLSVARGDGEGDAEPSLVPEVAVGYAVAPEDGEDAGAIVAAARAALRLARAGECRRAEPGGAAVGAASLDEFELWYQPIFDVAADEVVAVEALLRWPHPGLGLLGAGELLHAARESGSAGRLYEAILDRVCLQWRRWADSEIGAVEIGLNIDGPEWRSPRFVDRLAAALELHGVDPDFLRLEIDEDDLAGGAPPEALRRLGVRLCVHDFGAGNAALRTLRLLRGERIKLAREVVHGVPDEAEALRTAEAVAAICRSNDVEAVALGVEDPRQRRALEALGYELMQGVALHEPAPPSQCTGLLRERLRRRSHATVLPFRRLAGVS